MISIEQAIEKLLQHAPQVTTIETVTLTEATGRILAEDIQSTIDVPPADNSAMDGYAINTDNLGSDQAATTTLAISQTIAAGHPPEPLKPSTAARIFTGAEIPKGANAVVMQEHCNQSDGLVTVPNNVADNNNIRQQGQDISAGTTILSAGRVLQAQDLGLIASIGISAVKVYRRLQVAILSSGDELVEPSQPLKPGQIYNSNRYLLHGFLQRMGIHVLDLGTVEDTLEATADALQKAASADCIISTGGVSVGDEDHIKQAVTQLGNIDFWRIAIKPGKPVAFGSVGSTPFIGLPGNPASVFITFILLARPFLQQQQHQAYTPPKAISLPANFSWPKNPKRQEYLRAKINTEGSIDIFTNQSSGVLSSTSWAEGVVVVPAKTCIKKGEPVKFIDFKQLF